MKPATVCVLILGSSSSSCNQVVIILPFRMSALYLTPVNKPYLSCQVFQNDIGDFEYSKITPNHMGREQGIDF